MSQDSTLVVSYKDRGIWRQSALERLLGERFEVLHPLRRPSRAARAVVGWGRKPSGERAARLAEKLGLPCLRLEDGFVRSIALGGDEPPLSVVVDDLGIYYDATGPSRLEELVGRPLAEAERERARGVAALFREGRLSKYNHARDEAPPVDGGFVLVVDQTSGDESIRHGLAEPSSFSRMLEAALDEHPGLPVVLKVHPDVIAGKKRGHFEELSAGARERVRVLGSRAHVAPLLEAAEAVYAVTSQVGFEALLWGRPVRCFGMPFYAGWGLTEDELPAPSRRGEASLEQLVYAALVLYPRYLDPETGERAEPERLMRWMGLQRSMRARFPEQMYAAGFSRWKQPIVRRFFGGSEVRFVERAEEAPAGATVAIWGRAEVSAEGRSVLRVEDGFIRSVGLGAAHVAPLSWVFDREGIYYDATAPSELETILRETEFDDALLARARALRERIVASRLTKYNVGAGGVSRPEGASRVALVPGQVESDASIRFGGGAIKKNLELLRAAREAAPDAYLIYKPHPDVVAGHRERGEGEGEAAEIADEVVVDAPMDALLEIVDEVHTMTSLTGFEALLRGKKVVTYGRPFYAGWGLTEDRDPPARRGRALTLDALVAGALILYPTYVSRVTERFTTPERALDELVAWREGRV